jgi:Enterobacter phage Enc34, ssDNA-binding protein
MANPVQSNPALRLCVETQVGTMLLPAGRLSFPSLFEKKAVPGAAEETAKYSTAVMLPKDCDLRPLVAWIDRTAKAKWGPESLGKIKRPILKHAEKNADVELTTEFPYLIRCSSQLEPNVAFANGDRCSTKEEVYGGRWARVSVRIYGWEHRLNGRGISLGLSNVLLLDHDDRLGGGRVSIESEFAGYFQRDTDSIFS